MKSAEDAVKIIKSGDRVLIGHAVGEPSIVVEAMVKRAPELRDVEIFHMVAMGKGEYCKPEMAESFHYNGIFTGPMTREACNDGRGDYIPLFMHELPRLLTTRHKVNVALIQVSPPDEDGNCSYGVSCDYSETPARTRDAYIIAQVNKNFPYVYGTTISLDRIDCLVEADMKVIELTSPPIGQTEEMIGRHIADLINDGDCLQLGIGSIPDAVIRFIGDKKDLGMHTEMLSDGVVDLFEKGVINNSKKTLHPHKFVTNFIMGTRRLYDFVDHNRDVLLFPCDYTNDPYIIAQNDNMVAINTGIQIDLFGQLNSNTIGPNIYSGVGGQVDFIRGASRAKNGRAIIALPSTAKGGSISKIVARLDPGASVTTSRYDIRIVVTEFGVADLWGRNLRQRAKALIDIAHPNFREQLERQAWENGNLR
jgi:4-hydroxybutyrate CoA-transferase